MMILYVIYHGHGGHGQVTTSTHGDEVPADSGPRHNFVIRVMSNILMLIQFSTRIRSTFRLMGAIHNVQQSSVHIHKQEQLEIMILTECYKLFHLNFPLYYFTFSARHEVNSHRNLRPLVQYSGSNMQSSRVFQKKISFRKIALPLTVWPFRGL